MSIQIAYEARRQAFSPKYDPDIRALALMSWDDLSLEKVKSALRGAPPEVKPAIEIGRADTGPLLAMASTMEGSEAQRFAKELPPEYSDHKKPMPMPRLLVAELIEHIDAWKSDNPTPVESKRLDKGTINILKKQGFQTVGAIAAYLKTGRKLEAIEGVGEDDARRIREALKEYQRHVKMANDERAKHIELEKKRALQQKPRAKERAEDEPIYLYEFQGPAKKGKLTKLGRVCSSIVARSPKEFQPAAEWINSFDGAPMRDGPTKDDLSKVTDADMDCVKAYLEKVKRYNPRTTLEQLRVLAAKNKKGIPIDYYQQIGPVWMKLGSALHALGSQFFGDPKEPFRGITPEIARQVVLLCALLYDAGFSGQDLGLDWEYSPKGGRHRLEGRNMAGIHLGSAHGGAIVQMAKAATDQLKLCEEGPIPANTQQQRQNRSPAMSKALLAQLIQNRTSARGRDVKWHLYDLIKVPGTRKYTIDLDSINVDAAMRSRIEKNRD